MSIPSKQVTSNRQEHLDKQQIHRSKTSRERDLTSCKEEEEDEEKERKKLERPKVPNSVIASH